MPIAYKFIKKRDFSNKKKLVYSFKRQDIHTIDKSYKLSLLLDFLYLFDTKKARSKNDRAFKKYMISNYLFTEAI